MLEFTVSVEQVWEGGPEEEGSVRTCLHFQLFSSHLMRPMLSVVFHLERNTHVSYTVILEVNETFFLNKST